MLPAEFVSTEDGTGIVHMSPAYGEDDMATTQAAGIAAVTPVDSKGPLRRDRARTTPASMCSTPTRRSSAT